MKKSIQNWIIFSFLAISLTACALAMAPYRGDQTFKREVPRSINGVYRSILDYAITHNFEVPAHSEARGILRLRYRFPGASTWWQASGVMSKYTEPIAPTINPYGRKPFVTVSLKIDPLSRNKSEIRLISRFETFGEPQGIGGIGPFQLNSKGVWENELLDDLEASVIAAVDRKDQARRPTGATSGTAFFLNPQGYLLTNQHVVKGCGSITLKLFNQQDYEANVVAADQTNDLAVLKTKYQPRSHAILRGDIGVRSGDSVTAVGYPLAFVLSAEPRVTTGTVSAVSGIQGDFRVFQIEASVQPGNSGGPLLDDRGHVIGVVNSRLNDLAMVEATGSIPQNVNFAIKSSIVQIFLDANNISYFTSEPGPKLSTSQIMHMAREFTPYVQCNPR